MTDGLIPERLHFTPIFRITTASFDRHTDRGRRQNHFAAQETKRKTGFPHSFLDHLLATTLLLENNLTPPLLPFLIIICSAHEGLDEDIWTRSNTHLHHLSSVSYIIHHHKSFPHTHLPCHFTIHERREQGHNARVLPSDLSQIWLVVGLVGWRSFYRRS